MKRPDSTLSSMLAWICIPGILPSENGTVMRSYRPGAVVPTMTIASLNRAGSTSGFSPATICFSE